MSGPIVRKYGFPNFDKIFGERPLQHGAEDSEQANADTAPDELSKKKPRATAEKTPRGAASKKKAK
jgi:hypothetical protein